MTQSEKRLFLIQSLLKERPEYRQVETPRDPEGQRQLLRGLMNVRLPQAADPDFLRVQDAYLQAENITVIPFTFHTESGEQSCMDTASFDAKAFYTAMRNGEKVTTSQIPPHDPYS